MKIEREERNIIIVAFATVLITILVIIFSEEAYNSAFEGLKVWWEIVFPSLLPFFIIAEVLMGLGVVHFLGALLEPLMRPLFKVPGVGAFAMAMGLASGYPIGAKITGNLRRNRLCTKTEAERLLAFTNTADPLFMIGAVAVGFFHRPELGLIIAGAHYISSILIGLMMRFYIGNEKKSNQTQSNKNNNYNIFKNAIYELITARKNDGRNLGELLGDSVRESINTLLMIGGFIILFSVVTKIITVTGVIDYISYIVMFFLRPFGFSREMILPLISGIFEITNGANLVSQTQAPLLEQLIIVNAIIAWSGLSVHGQVATMINGTDINIKPYLFARIMQSLLAGIATIFLYIPLNNRISPAFNQVLNFNNFNVNHTILYILLIFILILTITCFLSLLIYLTKKIKLVIFHISSKN
ncbi:MAG: sporulation integral membrane protein YlbJ [Bacillota bacterium]